MLTERRAGRPGTACPGFGPSATCPSHPRCSSDSVEADLSEQIPSLENLLCTEESLEGLRPVLRQQGPDLQVVLRGCHPFVLHVLFSVLSLISSLLSELAHASLALSSKPSSTPSDASSQAAFHSMIQLALWGNATDLSLLAGGATEENLRELQSRGKDEERFILRNDEGKVWEWVQGLKGARADIVLDNGEFMSLPDVDSCES